MAPRAPQTGVPRIGGEDFTNALDEVPSDAETTGDEGDQDAAHLSVVPLSVLVPPEPSRVKIPKPGSSTQAYHVVSRYLLSLSAM